MTSTIYHKPMPRSRLCPECKTARIALGMKRCDNCWVLPLSDTDFAYFAGATYGDGCITKSYITFSVVDEEFATSYFKAAQRLGFKPRWHMELQDHSIRRDQFNVRVHCARLARMLRELKDTGYSKLESLCLISPENRIAFMRGFFEAEGTIATWHYQTRAGTKVYHDGNFSNTDLSILILVQRLADGLGYETFLQGPYTYSAKNRPYYHLQIAQHSLRPLIDVLRPCIKGERLRV